LGGLTKSDETFSWDSSFLEGDLREEGVPESLRASSVASSGLRDEPISGDKEGEEEEEEEF